MSLSNADLDALNCSDFLKEFRSIWRGKEIKLTEETSLFSIGRGKCTMILISGSHGTERSGPIALYNFAKWLSDHKINGKIYIVPILNPLAWNRKERAPNRLNTNRIWNEIKCKRALQIKKIMKLLKKEKPLIFGDFHEDDTIKDEKPYIFRFHDSEFAKKLQIEMNTSPRKGISRKHDGQTSESYAHSIGIIDSFTSESYPYAHIDDRVQFQHDIMRFCFKWANNKTNWAQESSG